MRNASLVALALLAGAACSRQPAAETETAVRQAVERYLASRPNLNVGSMNVSVGSIIFRGDTAEAEVTFRAKNDAKAVMSMRYSLRRKGGGWEVDQQATTETSGGGATPAGHPPVEPSQGAAPEADLPSGHPPVRPK